VIKSRKMN